MSQLNRRSGSRDIP